MTFDTLNNTINALIDECINGNTQVYAQLNQLYAQKWTMLKQAKLRISIDGKFATIPELMALDIKLRLGVVNVKCIPYNETIYYFTI